jgi:hypothetical protein
LCTTFAFFFILIFSVLKNMFLSSGPLLSCMPVHLYVQCIILLTGHNILRRHLHLTGLSDSPLCRCGAEEENLAHILCECEALASLRHAYLGSFFLDPEDIKSISLVAIWKFSKAIRLLWIDMGHKGLGNLRPRCIGTVGDRTQMQINQSINQRRGDLLARRCSPVMLQSLFWLATTEFGIQAENIKGYWM